MNGLLKEIILDEDQKTMFRNEARVVWSMALQNGVDGGSSTLEMEQDAVEIIYQSLVKAYSTGVADGNEAD